MWAPPWAASLSTRPVPSRPVPSRPVPFRPVPPRPSRPVPIRSVPSRPVPSRPVPSPSRPLLGTLVLGQVAFVAIACTLRDINFTPIRGCLTLHCANANSKYFAIFGARNHQDSRTRALAKHLQRKKCRKIVGTSAVFNTVNEICFRTFLPQNKVRNRFTYSETYHITHVRQDERRAFVCSSMTHSGTEPDLSEESGRGS